MWLAKANTEIGLLQRQQQLHLGRVKLPHWEAYRAPIALECYEAVSRRQQPQGTKKATLVPKKICGCALWKVGLHNHREADRNDLIDPENSQVTLV
jgi:hypothetical protein